MTIENHVTSLEISKRLKELGVRKNTIFSWKPTITTTNCPNNPTAKLIVDGPYNVYLNDMRIVQSWEIDTISKRGTYSAFLVSEILEIIPSQSFTVTKDDASSNLQYCALVRGPFKNGGVLGHFINPADCLASTLIDSLENNILKPEDLK